ncbi:MAG TPA: nicotinate-nucleotide adenylyltransferase [Gemmatimonadaceae bacterium]|nr:nicotinate-nucleotide adenylyltransferase [Gemmatimonadaceae bacterium]
MRIGIFGGTFDPPHVGHLLVASDAYEALALDRLLFIPAGIQPFKIGVVQASGAQRLAMLSLLIGDDPRFAVESIDTDRNGLSFTVDTLAALAGRDPDATRFLLIGEDLAGQIASWREPAQIARLAEIVVLARPSRVAPSEGRTGELPMRRIETRRVEVSSSEIRERVRAGRAIRGFVPEAVAGFIATAGLYR